MVVVDYFNATFHSIGLSIQTAHSNIEHCFCLWWRFGDIIVNMSENQQKKPDLGLLEEDDEFEEFPAEGLLNVGEFGEFIHTM